LLTIESVLLPATFTHILLKDIFHLTFTMHLAIFPIASVDLAIAELAFSEAVFFSVDEAPLVSFLITIVYDALSVVFVVKEHALIVLQIAFEYVSTVAREHIIAEPANQESLGVPLQPHSNPFAAHDVSICD